MPARFVYWMNVSVDLRIEHRPGEEGGGSWMRISAELHREFNARAQAMTSMVQGRTVYETMEKFWPAAAEDQTQPDVVREYGRIWTTKPKVLVSRTRASAEHNTRVIGAHDDAIEQLTALRAGGDGDIGVGGATLATQLLHAGLLDELLLFVHPAVLGSGRPLFDGPDEQPAEPIDLDLLEHRVFGEGVTMARYSVRGAPGGTRTHK